MPSLLKLVSQTSKMLDVLKLEASNGHVPWTAEELLSMRIVGYDHSQVNGTVATSSRIVTRPGDVWILGEHRLICGDSTKSEVVEQLMQGDKPFIMVTDPPYGVEYDAEWRKRQGLQMGGAYGVVSNDGECDWRKAWSFFSGDVVYCWSASLHTSEVQLSLEDAGFVCRCHIIWDKETIVVSRGAYHWQHEPCWYAVREGSTAKWVGGRNQSSLWRIPKNRASKTGHSTQKPMECMLRPIKNHGAPGDIVYDPFVGSGTTILASEVAGRRCRAVELSPQYCDVSIRRWIAQTGGEVIRESDGVLWTDPTAVAVT